eukprot:13952850-Heterocapsa_arctica.AAC.1
MPRPSCPPAPAPPVPRPCPGSCRPVGTSSSPVCSPSPLPWSPRPRAASSCRPCAGTLPAPASPACSAAGR